MWADWNTWDTGEAANIIDQDDNARRQVMRRTGLPNFKTEVLAWIETFYSANDIDESMRVNPNEIDWDELEEYFSD